MTAHQSPERSYLRTGNSLVATQPEQHHQHEDISKAKCSGRNARGVTLVAGPDPASEYIFRPECIVYAQQEYDNSQQLTLTEAR